MTGAFARVWALVSIPASLVMRNTYRGRVLSAVAGIDPILIPRVKSENVGLPVELRMFSFQKNSSTNSLVFYFIICTRVRRRGNFILLRQSLFCTHLSPKLLVNRKPSSNPRTSKWSRKQGREGPGTIVWACSSVRRLFI